MEATLRAVVVLLVAAMEMIILLAAVMGEVEQLVLEMVEMEESLEGAEVVTEQVLTEMEAQADVVKSGFGRIR